MCAQMVNQPNQNNDRTNDRTNEEARGPFRDTVVNSTLVEDPLFKFLSKYWRQVGLTIAAVLVSYFAVQSFKDTYVKSMQRAADLFVDVQKNMEGLPAIEAALLAAQKEKEEKGKDLKADQKAKDEVAAKVVKAEEDLKKAQDRLKDMLTALADTREPYSHLASTYKGLLAWKMNEFDSARGALESAAKWRNVAADGKERVFMEGAALALAGLMIEKSEFTNAARANLQDLARDGQYVNIVAALRLSRLASTADERKAARSLLEELMLKHPEQTELLSKEISQL